MKTDTPARIHVVHSDPGHGWLEASMVEVRKLGIASKISTCSYQSKDGKTVYLEEDCDVGCEMISQKSQGEQSVLAYRLPIAI